MAPSSRRDGKDVLDAEAILLLQRTYAEAVLARGDLPPEILEKYHRMQELHEKAFGERHDAAALKQLAEIATELLPYFHFKVDKVNWTEQ